MLPLGSPREAGAPCVHDLVEGAAKREREMTLEEEASAWPCGQDRGEILQDSREMASA